MLHDRLSAIFFDLDGTLRHSEPDGSETFCRFATELGARIPPERCRRARRWVHEYFARSSEFEADRLATGDDVKAFWLQYARRYLRTLGVGEVDLESLALGVSQRMRDEYEPTDYVPDDVLPTLGRLRGDGYRLGLVSNRSYPLDEIVASLEMGQYFDVTLAAGEIGRWKPDPELLLHALGRLGVLPEAAVYVGDNYYADVVGAHEAGVQPVLIDPEGLFPDADCPVITAIGELPKLLESLA